MARKVLFGVLILAVIGACADSRTARVADSRTNLDPQRTIILGGLNEGSVVLSQSRAQAIVGVERAVAPRSSQ